MKLCITSSGQNLDDTIDPRFGRCQYFIMVDSESMRFEAIQNPAISAGGGAGIQAAQLVANQGAEVVLTGNVGPNAFNTLLMPAWTICNAILVPASCATCANRYSPGIISSLWVPYWAGTDCPWDETKAKPITIRPSSPCASCR